MVSSAVFEFQIKSTLFSKVYQHLNFCNINKRATFVLLQKVKKAKQIGLSGKEGIARNPSQIKVYTKKVSYFRKKKDFLCA